MPATASRPPALSASPSRGDRRTYDVDTPDRLLVVDIETYPDPTALPPDWPAGRFPPLPAHRVACVSFVEADIEVDPGTGLETFLVTDVRSGGEPGWDEERLVRGFWRFFGEGRHRVVTWNGRSFDMPVLHLRALAYGIPAAAWFRRGTTWEGYTKRYAEDWHADLMECVSGHGAASRSSLDAVAAAMGLPGKAGEHGSDVARHVADGDLARVRRYCETDVLNLLGVYVRWALVTGRSDAAGHDRAMDRMRGYLKDGREQRPHLGEFLDRWVVSDCRPGRTRETDTILSRVPGR